MILCQVRATSSEHCTLAHLGVCQAHCGLCVGSVGLTGPLKIWESLAKLFLYALHCHLLEGFSNSPEICEI